MSISNQLRPKALPGRRWGVPGRLFRQVHYLLGDLGQLGFMARWRRQGRVPLELGARLAPVRTVFDHVEYWLCYADDLETRDLDRRVLVGHPYRFEQSTRDALAAACEQFGLVWSATPPKADAPAGAPTSWYSDRAWLIIVQPQSPFIGSPEPRECKIKRGRTERRPMIEGETLETLIEKPSARARKARRAARAGLPPQISFTDAIADTAESLAKLEKWRLLQEKLRQIAELEASRDVDRELEEADRRLAELGSK